MKYCIDSKKNIIIFLCFYFLCQTVGAWMVGALVMHYFMKDFLNESNITIFEGYGLGLSWMIGSFIIGILFITTITIFTTIYCCIKHTNIKKINMNTNKKNI